MESKEIEKKLCSTQQINNEIKYMTEELKRLEGESYVKGGKITGLPSGTKTKDNVSDRAIKKVELEDQIKGTIALLYKERREAEEIVSNARESEKRQILRLRCINGMTWKQLAAELFMDEKTARKKYKEALSELAAVI
ncbi:hypothetical protein [Velocimicrobium porci]|uniref:Uncharacterized protein n=1 Tax=Velocimicrobium porci TaxID=2606634 RepID=A0A6L5XX24_9FIRM|nr:hypothetical protein [Velocimicrobium porci]MSS63169.1 hypothetical protein [Velocimicrobium porci]